MKLSSFATLDAVLRTGSQAAAASEVNLTASAVSMQMRQLEVYFGQALFDRSGLKVRPTAFALEVGTAIRHSLQQIELLRRPSLLTVEGHVRLGVIETLQTTLLPGLLQRLGRRHPGLVLKPVRGRSSELLAALKAGQLDAAVLIQPERGGAQRLDWQPLMRQPMVLVAPPDASSTRLVSLFQRYPWVRFDPLTHTGRVASQYLRQQGVSSQPSMDLQSVQAIVAMVSAGLGVSVLPQPDARLCLAYPVRVLSLGADAPALQVAFVARKPDAGQRPLLATLETVREVVQAQALAPEGRGLL